MTFSPRFLPMLLREALPVALVGMLVFQVLRICVAERYVVPTASMEPCLHGDPVDGDVVLVEKVSSWFGPRLERYDLVVVRRPPESGGHHVVKRVVAFGDKEYWLRLEEGDLWVGPARDQLRREMKDPLQARRLRVPWFEYPPRGPGDEVAQCLNAGTGELQPDGIALPKVAEGEARVREELGRAARRRRLEALPQRTMPPGFCGLLRPVDTSWLDASGRRAGRGGQGQVNDFGAQLDVVMGNGGSALVFALELRPDTFAWICRADGSVQFLHDGEVVANVAGPRWNAGAPLHFEYGFLDNRFFLIAGDQIVDLRVRAAEWHGSQEGLQAGSGPPTLLYFAALGGAARIARLQVFRDLYWYLDKMPFREQREQAVAPGHIYLLGDNSFDSQDSRFFGSVPLSDYVGRPLLVLGPWARARMLRQ